MAIVHGKDAKVYIDGEPIGDLTEWTLDLDAGEPIELGLESWSGSFEGTWQTIGTVLEPYPPRLDAEVIDLALERRRRRGR